MWSNMAGDRDSSKLYKSVLWERLQIGEDKRNYGRLYKGKVQI